MLDVPGTERCRKIINSHFPFLGGGNEVQQAKVRFLMIFCRRDPCGDHLLDERCFNLKFVPNELEKLADDGLRGQAYIRQCRVWRGQFDQGHDRPVLPVDLLNSYFKGRVPQAQGGALIGGVQDAQLT